MSISQAILLSLFTSSAASAGQQEYTSYGTYYFVVPAGITSISAVAVGGGGTVGGGGGGLSYGTISVTPGETLTVIVGRAGRWGIANGGNSSINRSSTQLMAGYGGTNGNASTLAGGSGGAYFIDTSFVTNYGGGYGGNAGAGVNPSSAGLCSNGGGGAAGYTANGGNGGDGSLVTSGGNGSAGSGGGGGGGGGGAPYTEYDSNCDYTQHRYGGGAGSGGSIGIYGQGSNGAGGNGQAYAYDSRTTFVDGDPGSGGITSPTYIGAGTGGGEYGEYIDLDCNVTTSYTYFNNGDYYSGAVRIIWGTGRAYPSTNTADV